MFLAVTAEEQGLLGSQYYAVSPIYPLAKTVANLNVDVLNTWGETGDLTVIGLGNSELDDYAMAAAKEQNRTLNPDAEPEKGFYYRSDHFNFAKQGVPAFYAEGGMTFTGKPADFGRQKSEEYNKVQYHQPQDEILPGWDLSGGVQDMQLRPVQMLDGEFCARTSGICAAVRSTALHRSHRMGTANPDLCRAAARYQS